jgi:hypothetical protein
VNTGVAVKVEQFTSGVPEIEEQKLAEYWVVALTDSKRKDQLHVYEIPKWSGKYYNVFAYCQRLKIARGFKGKAKGKKIFKMLVNSHNGQPQVFHRHEYAFASVIS